MLQGHTLHVRKSVMFFFLPSMLQVVSGFLQLAHVTVSCIITYHIILHYITLYHIM